MTLFHFRNYCLLDKNNFPFYRNHCYMDKTYPSFRKTYSYFGTIIIKHVGHLEMDSGFTETKRQSFYLYFWLSKLNVSQPVCHAHFWEKKKESRTTVLRRLMLHPKTYILLWQEIYMQAILCYLEWDFLSLIFCHLYYGHINYSNTTVIHNLEITYTQKLRYSLQEGMITLFVKSTNRKCLLK